MRPNPLSDVEYLELLIESEKIEHKTGWENRVKQYKKLCANALLLKKLPKVSKSDKKNKSWWEWWKS